MPVWHRYFTGTLMVGGDEELKSWLRELGVNENDLNKVIIYGNGIGTTQVLSWWVAMTN